MWREPVRRERPDLAAEWFEMDEEAAIEAILEAGAGPGGPTEGITLDALKAGPVRLNVPDPDVAFVEQVRDRTPFPPVSLPAPLEKTAAFIPTRRIEFYKDDDRFLELGETVPTYRPPFDDTVHDPVTYPLALLSPHSKWRIHSTYANNAWLTEIHGGRPEVFLSAPDADARGGARRRDARALGPAFEGAVTLATAVALPGRDAAGLARGRAEAAAILGGLGVVSVPAVPGVGPVAVTPVGGARSSPGPGDRA